MNYYKKYIKYKNKYLQLKNQKGGVIWLIGQLQDFININKTDTLKQAEQYLNELKNIHSRASEQYKQIIENNMSTYNIFKTSDTQSLKFNIQDYLTDNNKEIIKEAQKFYNNNVSRVQPDY
jgi:hypothetical protein